MPIDFPLEKIFETIIAKADEHDKKIEQNALPHNVA